MIQDIMNGIIAALHGTFPETEIYTEQIEQGLTEPCFILRCVNPRNELFFDRRYKRDNLFSVIYIPASVTDAKIECYSVLEELYQILEHITVGGGLMRGTGMRGEFADNELIFLVNYNCFVIKQKEIEPMGELNIDVDIDVMGGLSWQNQQEK